MMLWLGVKAPGCYDMCFKSSFSDKYKIEDKFHIRSRLWFPTQVHISKQL